MTTTCIRQMASFGVAQLSGRTNAYTTVRCLCAAWAARLLGHPFNPPQLIHLVEVIGGQKTSATASDTRLGVPPRMT